MRILGIDPGYAIVGYGAIAGPKGPLPGVGVWGHHHPGGSGFRPAAGGDLPRHGGDPQPGSARAAAVEKLYFTNNKTTGIGVAEARGVILLALAQHGVPLFEYTPMQVKQAVTGYGKALKPQVQEMTRRLLRLPEVPRARRHRRRPGPGRVPRARRREAPCGRPCCAGATSRSRRFKRPWGGASCPGASLYFDREVSL